MRYKTNTDLPLHVKKVLPSSKGRALFRTYFDLQVQKQADERIAFAEAWAALEKSGYSVNDGKYIKKGVLDDLYNLIVDELKPDSEMSPDNAPIKGTYSSVKPNTHSADLLYAWMIKAGIPNPVPKEKLHSTILYSRDEFGGYRPREEMTVVKPFNLDTWGFVMDGYSLRRMGENKDAIVLTYVSPDLMQQFYNAMALGASWDFNNHVLHITLSYDAPDLDISKLTLPDFEIVFDPEVVEPLVEDWADTLKFYISGKITKINDEQMMVFGYANVIEENGIPVVDLQGDVIDESDLVKAAHEFMLEYRAGHSMHDGINKGDIVESIVFTKDLQKALGIDLGMVGWFIGYQVNDQQTWDKVKKGEFTAFSIGGNGIREPI